MNRRLHGYRRILLQSARYDSRMAGDLGEIVIAGLRELVVERDGDDRWILDRDAYTFDWWFGPLAQHCFIDCAFEDEEFEVFRVNVRTDFVRNCPIEGPNEASLAGLMADASLWALAPDTEDPNRLGLQTTVYVHLENFEVLLGVLVRAIELQLASALGMAEEVGRGLVADLDASEHPINGPRPDETDLSMYGRILEAGSEPSDFPANHIGQVLAELQQPPCVLATGDETGFSAEFPFVGQTSLLRWQTDKMNLQCGTGLSSRLTVPDRPAGRSAVRTALNWNRMELDKIAKCHLLGSWAPSEYGMQFASFWPNALANLPVIGYLYGNDLIRANWIAEAVYGDDWMNGGFELAYQNKMGAFERAVKPKGLRGLFRKR